MATLDKRKLQSFASRTRVIILSDISNEPDDAESLVRYLLYSNQFKTEGLVAVTSNWMKTKVCPQDIHKIIDAFESVVPNLNAHTHPDYPYPSAAELRRLVKRGAEVSGFGSKSLIMSTCKACLFQDRSSHELILDLQTYGMSAVGPDIPLSEGGELLLSRIQDPDPMPLWVLCWGGTNVLAQVLLKIHSKYPEAKAASLRSKIRVYAISDQDDTGAWIRTTFPDLFYICSVHAWNQYGMAAWTGISGDHYYGFDAGGPDYSKFTKEWIKENIQIGVLGRAYPNYLFIPEGDTPTFLYLIQNGLGMSEHPDYGSWGGRYSLTNKAGADGTNMHYSDAADKVTGQDGKSYVSNHATIWRWRDAFQNDFAARIQWSLSQDVRAVNHHPVISINGSKQSEALHMDCEAGETISLDASATYDPDDDELIFRWFHYREPSATQWSVAYEVEEVDIKAIDAKGSKVEITLPPPEKCCVDLMSQKAQERGQLLHVILEVQDTGTPQLTSYTRLLIQATNKELKGGGQGLEAIGDILKDM